MLDHASAGLAFLIPAWVKWSSAVSEADLAPVWCGVITCGGWSPALIIHQTQKSRCRLLSVLLYFFAQSRMWAGRYSLLLLFWVITLQIMNKALLESSLPTININTSSAADRAQTNSCFLLGFTPSSAITLHSVSSGSCRHCALVVINQSLKENTGNENVNYTVSLVRPQNRWEIHLSRRGRRIMCEMSNCVSPFLTL